MTEALSRSRHLAIPFHDSKAYSLLEIHGSSLHNAIPHHGGATILVRSCDVRRVRWKTASLWKGRAGGSKVLPCTFHVTCMCPTFLISSVPFYAATFKRGHRNAWTECQTHLGYTQRMTRPRSGGLQVLSIFCGKQKTAPPLRGHAGSAPV